MDALLKEFLQFIRLNRTVSAHTTRAYASDLSQFLNLVSDTLQTSRTQLTPGHLDRLAIRGFMADLHKRGLSRASAARKLAAVRTFLRYLRREGLVEHDPGPLVPTPKRAVRIALLLSAKELGILVNAP